MPTYTIRLDQLHASFMRDKTQDDLIAWLWITVDGEMIPSQNPPPDGSQGNPVTGQLASGVHSGDSIRFADYKPVVVPAWEFTFSADGPDDTIVSISIVVTNTHGEPSEDVQRELVKTYFSMAGGAIGAIGGAGTVSVIEAMIGGAVGEGVGTGFASLFKDPPQCQGTVFAHTHILSLGALNRLPYSDGHVTDTGEETDQWSTTVSSEPITDAKPECGHAPDYQLTFSILRETQLLFGKPGIEGTQEFIGALDRGLDQWVGEWDYQASVGEPSRISCTIVRSLAHPQALHVTLSEHFGSWNGAEIVSLDIDGIIPQRRQHTIYTGDMLPGKRHVFIPPFITQLQQRSSMSSSLGVVSSPVENVSQSSMSIGETQHAIGSVFSDHLQPVVLPILMDQADTIVIADKSVDLCLYVHAVNDQEAGLFVRYIRDANLSFTRTDTLLGHPSILH